MDKLRVWNKILDYVRDKISPPNFRTWFGKASFKDITDQEIIISVPSAFIKDQLTLRYKDLIDQAILETLGQEFGVVYKIDSSLDFKQEVSEKEDFFELTPQNHPHLSILNPKYTLEHFVVGLTNNLAYAAAQAVVQNPGITYNPLFIYGPSGVGKTHLMQAIGNALLKKTHDLKIIYASSERFMNDLVISIQTKTTLSFRQKYRSSDILLIDDVQFISGKDSTQEEFFHTYNDLHSKNSQLVFTSDRPPNEIQKLESRLASRFQGGLMVDIQLPDFDTRVAILKSKLSEKKESLPEEYLHMIAEVVQSNTRELEGKLTQILQMTKINGQGTNEETIRKILGKSEVGQTILDHKKVLTTINTYFNIKTVDLLGPRRQKELVLPRHIAMFLMYESCKIPMEKIGEILGGRDHTTVLHGIEKIRGAMSRDREIQRLVIEVKQQLTH